MPSIAGLSALVTGGGSGIGRAIALGLANAGVEVTVCGRRIEPLEETVQMISSVGGTADAISCDLTDTHAIERLAAQLVETREGVDILVNNAGFNSNIRSARYIRADEWREVMNVNTMAPAMLTRSLLEPMIARGRGHIVMISSNAAIRPGVLAGVVYSSAKSAARAYMEVLSAEVRQLGIRCTTICPGEVDTAIMNTRALPPDEATLALMMQPEDIAATVIMAVSLPERANVSEVVITATFPRDMSKDVEAALNKTETVVLAR